MNEKDYLYAPWRLAYVASAKEPGCVLCRYKDPSLDEQNLIVKRFEHCYIMLNLYPYNNGHIMVVPYRHVSNLNLLKQDERIELIEVLSLAEEIIRDCYKCEGINIGLNLGKAAGAGIDEHLHFHLVPRWMGDSNFLSVISGERVVPESFESAYKKLKEAFAKC